MGYVYRAKTGAFYCDELEKEYRKAGTWPGFFVRVSDEDYRNLMEGIAQGKIIVPDKKCYPVLQERPAPSKEDLIYEVEYKRQLLIDSAMQSISVIQIKQMNGRKITAEENSKINNVLDYLDELEALDLADPQNIVWPEVRH